MEHDDGPANQPRSPKAATTDAELSRMGREAVRQSPDPRLDKELARMGLTDEPTAAEGQPGQARGRSVAIGPELERLRKDLRRVELVLWVLAAVTGILAILVLVLLAR